MLSHIIFKILNGIKNRKQKSLITYNLNTEFRIPHICFLLWVEPLKYSDAYFLRSMQMYALL